MIRSATRLLAAVVLTNVLAACSRRAPPPPGYTGAFSGVETSLLGRQTIRAAIGTSHADIHLAFQTGMLAGVARNCTVDYQVPSGFSSFFLDTTWICEWNDGHADTSQDELKYDSASDEWGLTFEQAKSPVRLHRVDQPVVSSRNGGADHLPAVAKLPAPILELQPTSPDVRSQSWSIGGQSGSPMSEATIAAAIHRIRVLYAVVNKLPCESVRDTSGDMIVVCRDGHLIQRVRETVPEEAYFAVQEFNYDTDGTPFFVYEVTHPVGSDRVASELRAYFVQDTLLELLDSPTHALAPGSASFLRLGHVYFQLAVAAYRDAGGQPSQAVLAELSRTPPSVFSPQTPRAPQTRPALCQPRAALASARDWMASSGIDTRYVRVLSISHEAPDGGPCVFMIHVLTNLDVPDGSPAVPLTLGVACIADFCQAGYTDWR